MSQDQDRQKEDQKNNWVMSELVEIETWHCPSGFMFIPEYSNPSGFLIGVWE